METTIIKVAGMSCGGCVKSIAQVLLGLPGVASASVSLEQGEATVEFESSKVTLDALKNAIDDAGFAAS
jgi:copper chaperone